MGRRCKMGQLLHDNNEELGYRLPLDRSIVAIWVSCCKMGRCCKMCQLLQDGSMLQDGSVAARWVGVARCVSISRWVGVARCVSIARWVSIAR